MSHQLFDPCQEKKISFQNQRTTTKLFSEPVVNHLRLKLKGLIFESGFQINSLLIGFYIHGRNKIRVGRYEHEKSLYSHLKANYCTFTMILVHLPILSLYFTIHQIYLLDLIVVKICHAINCLHQMQNFVLILKVIGFF